MNFLLKISTIDKSLNLLHDVTSIFWVEINGVSKHTSHPHKTKGGFCILWLSLVREKKRQQRRKTGVLELMVFLLYIYSCRIFIGNIEDNNIRIVDFIYFVK
jgi:hypothetical protein